MNQAIVKIHDILDHEGEVELLHQVHDEIVLQCVPKRLPHVLAATKQIMETPFSIHSRKIHVPTEAGVGPLGGSWGAVEKVKGR